MRRTHALLAAFTATLLWGSVSSAAITIYTDRSAWEAAVGGDFSAENFESFQTGVSYEFTPVDVGDFVVSVAGDTFGFNFHNIGPSTANDVNGSSQLNAATGANGGTTLSFDNNLMGFGADWQGVSNERTTSIDINGSIIDIPAINGGFFGFVADDAFMAPELFLTSGSPDGFGIDNLVYATARVSVPEAGSLALLVLGLGVLGCSRRRR